MSTNIPDVIRELDPKSKVLGLSVLLSEALFLAALTRLPVSQVLVALGISAAVLVAGIAAVVTIETRSSQGARSDKSRRSAAARIIPNRVDFYDEIAPVYDKRNTSSLLETHRAVIAEVTEMLDQLGSLEVLDLGGGTGRLVAAHFFQETRVHWTCVDSSPGMLEQFRRNLSGTQLRNERVLSDLDCLESLDGRTFDVVLICLVLTSLKRLPDFGAIARLIRPGGRLVVADIDPVYSVSNPLYAVNTQGGEMVALEVVPRHPLDVLDMIAETGLKTIDTNTIFRADGVRYSYLLVAEKDLATPTGIPTTCGATSPHLPD